MRKLFIFLYFIPMLLIAEEYWEISAIHISIEGRTKEEVLLEWMSLKEGDVFNSQNDMLHAIDALQEEINNNRIFEENARITWQETGFFAGNHAVDLFIVLEESWSIILLPYGKYDSNTGLELSMKFRHYNFLGFMDTLTVDLEYSAEEEGMDFSFFVPMNAMAFELNYQADFSGEFHNELFFGTSYRYKFPIFEHDFSLKATEGLYYLPQDNDESFYLYSELAMLSNWEIPWKVYNNFEPKYTAELSVNSSYLPSFTDYISQDREGVILQINHGISLGRADYGDNNYKDGLVLHINHINSYNINSNLEFHERWSGDITGSAEYFMDLYPWGAALRVSGVHDLYEQAQWGQYFRGIFDDNIEARSGIIINSALYITVWNWDPIWEWYGGPTLDIGYFNDVPENQENMQVAVGVEGLAFPYLVRSLFARFSVGVDLLGVMDEGTENVDTEDELFEIFFGLGAFY